MSVNRPPRQAQFFSIHEVETFQALSPVTITSVSNAGTQINLDLSDPNGGADLFQYTYIVHRAVDGVPFREIYRHTLGAIATTLTDSFIISLSQSVVEVPELRISVILPIGSIWSVRTTPGFAPTMTPTEATLPLDTELLTTTGNSIVLPSGTRIIIPAGTNWASVATPRGHTYNYQVAVVNRFDQAPLSAANGVAVASDFAAQTLDPLARTDNEITLTWTDTNVYATGNRIEIFKDIDGAGFALLTKIVKESGQPMPTTYTDAFDFFTMVPATYSYKLRAVSDNPRDLGPFSNTESIVVNFSLDPLHSLVAAMAAGDTQVNLSWVDPNNPADEAGIKVERQIGSGVFSLVATLPPGATSHVDAFVTEPGQTYIYRVRAFNSLHDGPPSATASATAALLTPAITVLTQLADTGIRVSWSDANIHQTAYDIERDINGGGFILAGTATGSARSFDDSVSLALNNIVTYRVRAKNAATTGAFSTTVSITITRTLAAPESVTPIFVNDDLIRITWKRTNVGHRGARIFRSEAGGAFAQIATLPRDALSYDDAFSVTHGQTYSYKVHDFNDQETSDDSEIGSLITPFTAPFNLVATTVAETATLTWQTPNTIHDSTEIFRAFGDREFAFVGSVPAGTTTAQVSVVGGTPGDVVRFRVRDVKEPTVIFGTSQIPRVIGRFSEIASTAAPLLAPENIQVTRPSPNFNRIVWTDPNALSTGYKIFRKITVGASQGPLTHVGTTPNLVFDDHSQGGAGITYEYQVLAFNADTSSPLSAVASITLRFGRPTVTAVQTLRTRVTVTVTPPSGYTPVGGDQLRVSRAKNGGQFTVFTTISASATPSSFNDDDVAIGDRLSYTAQLISATEAGLVSEVDTQEVFDIVLMPLGAVRQIRPHGSRTQLIQRGVFAACDGGLVKITTNPIDQEPVTTTQASSLANAKTVVSGSILRCVVFTGTAPGNGNMVLVDANNLNVITSQSMTRVTASGSIFGGWGKREVRHNPLIVGGQYDARESNLSGWFFSESRFTTNMALVDFSSITPTNTHTTWQSGLSGFINFTFDHDIGSLFPNPVRIETILGGRLFYFAHEGGGVSTPIRRSFNPYETKKFDKTQSLVADFVTDDISKVYAVTDRGDIVLIDFSASPDFPSQGTIGRLPRVRAGDPADVGAFVLDRRIDLAANRRLIVSTSYQIGPRFFSDIFVFSIPLSVSVTTPLTLVKTHTVDEKVGSLAFDGLKFFYASSTQSDRLFRFDIEF